MCDIDEIDDEVEVNFLEPKKNLFQKPRNSDSAIWVPTNSILCKISDPEPTGKSKRMYKLSENDREQIIKLFDDRHAQM